MAEEAGKGWKRERERERALYLSIWRVLTEYQSNLSSESMRHDMHHFIESRKL